MGYNTKLKIGEFSRMMQVTIKTLRFYEQKGLLLPCQVDEWTGYRYYSIEQMQKLSSIREMQWLGFSLDEIKEMYEAELHEPTDEQIKEKLIQTERQIKELSARRAQLLNWKKSRKKIKTMDKFSIQRLPEIIVASHREVLRNYEAIGQMCVNVIAPEMLRLGCKCLQPGYCFSVEHNDSYQPENVDIEYCEQVEEMGKDSSIIQFKRLPEVPTALCMKHYGTYDRFYESYVEVFKYIEQHGYKVVGRPRCCYVDGIWNQEDPEKWLSIIQVPVEK
ncbi:MAG: MerR family transcriptional regulator [Paludibacteraceae bacterium]|nr:MerR family transcriptional regulator [Paludibacteraceae bacterium]